MDRTGRRIYGMAANRRRLQADFVKKYSPLKITPTYIWRPCIASWEKEFTLQVGNFKWGDFVEAKKISMPNNIMEWEDTACEEAFIAAKRRFWDHYNGYESEFLLPDSDMYLDKNIDWNSESQENREDDDPMFSTSDAEDDVSKLTVVNEVPPLRFEDIIPTGWDVDVPQTTDLLTGLVVGEDDPENDNVLRDSMNIAKDLPTLRKFRQRR